MRAAPCPTCGGYGARWARLRRGRFLFPPGLPAGVRPLRVYWPDRFCPDPYHEPGPRRYFNHGSQSYRRLYPRWAPPLPAGRVEPYGGVNRHLSSHTEPKRKARARRHKARQNRDRR